MKTMITSIAAVLRRVTMVLLAGVFICLTAACSGATDVQARGLEQAKQGIPGHQSQPYEGGMNGYSDVDPRFNARGAKAEAKALVDKAERNVIDMSDDVGTNTGRILNKKGENAEQLGDNIKSNVKNFDRKLDRAANDAQGVAEDVKDNLRNARRNYVDPVGETLQNTGENIKQSVRNTADYAKDKAS